MNYFTKKYNLNNIQFFYINKQNDFKIIGKLKILKNLWYLLKK